MPSKQEIDALTTWQPSVLSLIVFAQAVIALDVMQNKAKQKDKSNG